MSHNSAPSITDSLREERLAFVRERYQCISNCDLCGNCAIFGRAGAEDALADYIEGKVELREALVRLRNSRRTTR